MRYRAKNPDETKLPKWAQSELNVLRLNLASKEKEIREMTGADPSRIIVELYREHIGAPMLYLPDEATVQFVLNLSASDARGMECDIRIATETVHRGGREWTSVPCLKVQCSNAIDVPVIRAEASNSFRIYDGGIR